jgi:hypothetical protein
MGIPDESRSKSTDRWSVDLDELVGAVLESNWRGLMRSLSGIAKVTRRRVWCVESSVLPALT